MSRASTRTYYWDGVRFSLDIEGAHRGVLPIAALFHPNHLIYNVAGYSIYSVLLPLWPNLRAIHVLQTINIVLSLLAGYVLFLIAKRITDNRGVAFFCWLLFTTGATWWKFSTDADSYVACVLFLLLSALFLLSARPRIVPAALCHAAAMLFHELAIFAYVPVLAWIFFDLRKTPRSKLRIALLYGAGTLGPVAIAYWFCYMQANHALYPTLLSWITSFAADSGFTHSIGEIIGYYLTSYVKLFAGGKLSLIRDFFSFLECAALLLCAVFLIWAIRLFKKPHDTEEASVDQKAVVFLWAWLIGYALFLAAWDPGSAFHKLLVWPAIVLLLGVYIVRAQYARQRVRASTILGAALTAWNFGAFIYPHSQPPADPVLMLALKLNRELPKDATVYFKALDPDDWYLEYFAPGRRWIPLPKDRRDLPKAIGLDAGPVCFETTALDSLKDDPALDEGMILWGHSYRRWYLVNSHHNIRLECLKRSQ